MKRAKSVLLILSIIWSFLIFIAAAFVGIVSLILLNKGIDVAKVATDTGLNQNTVQSVVDLLSIVSIPLIVYAVLSLVDAIIAINALSKKIIKVYVVSIIFGVITFNPLMILGSIFGIVSFRNGDELDVQ